MWGNASGGRVYSTKGGGGGGEVAGEVKVTTNRSFEESDTRYMGKEAPRVRNEGRQCERWPKVRKNCFRFTCRECGGKV